jgi:hypothetical protein
MTGDTPRAKSPVGGRPPMGSLPEIGENERALADWLDLTPVDAQNIRALLQDEAAKGGKS